MHSYRPFILRSSLYTFVHTPASSQVNLLKIQFPKVIEFIIILITPSTGSRKAMATRLILKMKENTQTGGWHRQGARSAVANVAADAPSEERELKGKSLNQGGKKMRDHILYFV